MVLANEEPGTSESHPYWYARIIGIFHANVFHVDPKSTSPGDTHTMDFLWVRWFGHDTEYRSGFKARRLPRIGFFDGNEDRAFGFLDPNDIIRAAHLMPAFSQGRSRELLGRSIAHNQKDEEEWLRYYVGMFADRDMVMRYLGGGIGHKATHDFAPPLPHRILLWRTTLRSKLNRWMMGLKKKIWMG
ncbi:uncharacterized protein LACBIDRAFT_316366 [Laccaria bicolor S238N-H82]|uniref:Uncharacterized protein n=1 Tax=Laccaria bicolor (strain S238N-H82 / ATCC MYA-4686) TaxID=486041 RepID=B0E0T6_LACBS|nr:uncharacterized protein LACBIDRAFT_316366 [Laccaria bicolor S238N-H82]EDQ99584.1 hypothetical protein LACBIDRAFT_316366 [Laccaria bicolor S238N-H82]|eukprot:XP_001889808.1 hypothetical protein LACBIDRAFT_316366 [Laccaria bicolor S238N-H82]